MKGIMLAADKPDDQGHRTERAYPVLAILAGCWRGRPARISSKVVLVRSRRGMQAHAYAATNVFQARHICLSLRRPCYRHACASPVGRDLPCKSILIASSFCHTAQFAHTAWEQGCEEKCSQEASLAGRFLTMSLHLGSADVVLHPEDCLHNRRMSKGGECSSRQQIQRGGCCRSP